MWPEPLSRREGRTGPPRCSRLSCTKGVCHHLRPGNACFFGEAGNGLFCRQHAVGNYLPFSRLRSSAAPGLPRGDLWRVSSRGTIPAGDINQEVRAPPPCGLSSDEQHAWDATTSRTANLAIRRCTKSASLPPACKRSRLRFSLTTHLRPELNTRRFFAFTSNSSRPLRANSGHCWSV